MKNITVTNSIFLLVGFLLCLYLTKFGCVEIPTKTEVIDTGGWVEHIHDTLVLFSTETDTIFKPTIVYKKVAVLPDWVKDSLRNLPVVYKDSLRVDSIMIDTSTFIGINHYTDTLSTDKYKLVWNAETVGFLTSMLAEVSTFGDTVHTKETITKIPKWNVSVGISNHFHPKFGVGYKGWNVEAEVYNNLKSVYLTKHFYF